MGLSPLNLAPGESATLKVPLEKPVLNPGSEYFLKVIFSLKTDELWAKAGHEVAWEQFLVPWSAPVYKSSEEEVADIMVQENDSILNIVGKNFEVIFNKKVGTITDLTYFNTHVLKTNPKVIYGEPIAPDMIAFVTMKPQDYGMIAGPTLNIFRAPIDNDHSFGRGPAPKWRDAQLWNLSTEVIGFKTEKISGSQVAVNVKIKSTAPKGYSVTTESKYIVNGNGQIDVQNVFESEKAGWSLPKIGFLMVLPEGYENIEYFGAGPYENYVDRKSGSAISRYKTTVDDMFVPYIRTQDCGNRSDVRWVTVTNRTETGIMVVAKDHMNFSALHYTPLDLEIANHPYELKKRKETILTVDLAHNGLGGGSCGPPPLDCYLLNPGKAEFNYSIRPYTRLLGDKANLAK